MSQTPKPATRCRDATTPPPIRVRGRPLGAGRLPLVCTPIVAASADQVLAEARRLAARGPDLLEWRIDRYEAAPEVAAVVDLARAIRQATGGLPLLATLRGAQEGGALAGLRAAEVVAVYAALAESATVDLVDFELSNDEADFAAVRAVTAGHQVALVASFHDFARTPSAETLMGIIELAVRRGADVAKIAVMPQAPADVLTLLQVTDSARQRYDIPLITMSMGACGAVSRAVGWLFGSQVSFAVGEGASAPGQLAMDDLQRVVEVLRRARDS